MSKLKFSVEVYEDFAIVKGTITSEMLMLIIRLCKKEGFTYFTYTDQENEFKLERK